MRIVRNLLTILVILWGLAILAGRIATPLVSDYRAQIAAELQQRFGVPVAIEGLRARWFGFTPRLELHRVRVGDAADRLALDQVSVELALPALLWSTPLDALRVTVDGLQLTMVREPSGQLHLEGFGLIRQDASESRGRLPLPRRLHLVNTRLVWIDRKVGKPPLAIDDINVILERDDEVLDLHASLETGSGRATLAARVEGFLTTTSWDGETYLKVENIDVAKLFTQYLPPQYGLRALELDLESWGRWRDAVALHNQGRLAVRDLDIRPMAAGSQPLKIDHAVADFSFQRPATGGVRLGLSGLSLTMNGRRWPTGDLALSVAGSPDQGTRVSAAADYLRIEDVVQMLQVRLPLADLQQPLARLQPRGEVRDLKLLAETQGDALAWRARARLDGVSSAPWDKIPGVDNLSGHLQAQQDHLVLHLDSRDAGLRFSELFRDPLQFRQLSGRLDVLHQDDGWQLLSRRLVADTPHIRTRTRLDLRQQAGRPLFLDLQTDFRDGDAAFAGRYYPVAIMGQNLVRWLDRSVASGRVLAGTALLHGPLYNFPFDKSRSGSFQVVFDVDDVLLDYQSGWPKIEQLDARVKFHGNQLDIAASSGAVYDSQVVGASAHIGSLKPVGPLRVNGQLTGPLANNLRVLQEDALKDRFGAIGAALRGSGETRLELDFSVPLAEGGEYALDGRLHFDTARLSLPDWDFAISDVSGRLDFTLDGLSAQGIGARVMGAPVVVDIAALDDGLTRVRSRGRFSVDAIRRQVRGLPDGLASGAADFVVDVEMPGRAAGGGPTVLAVNSDLQGVTVALPPPFGKTAEQSRAFALRVPISRRETPGTLTYGRHLAAAFSGDAQRVDIVLGGAPAALRPEPGIRILGRLAKVDMPAWGHALERLAPTGGEQAPPVDIDLLIGRLQAATTGVDDLHVVASRTAGLWQGTVEGATLAGSFSAPAALDQAPIRIDLQRLDLSLPVGGKDGDDTPPPDPTSGPDPVTLPGLVLDIADLRVNQARLGRLRFDGQHAPEGLRVTRLSLQGGELELTSAGHWSRTADRLETRLGGRVSAADLGDLLVNLGYSRQVEKAAGNIEFLLRWPGGPAQMHRSTVDGKVSLDIGDGRLVELDPGVTRVTGLMNLNALTRRLRLDFSDFYKKGYSFDSIRGDFTFADGRAATDNLTVLGPSGRIVLDGSADLAARTLDQHVTVVPKLDATLPIAGTLAGGPIAGIAVLIAQQVMTEDIDRLNRFEYRLSGPWANPEIRQLDTGGTLSKILKPLSGGTRDKAAADQAPTPEASPASAPPAAPETASGQSAVAGHGPQAQTQSRPEEAVQQTGNGNPLRGLLDLLKKGEPHGGELPGSDE